MWGDQGLTIREYRKIEAESGHATSKSTSPSMGEGWGGGDPLPLCPLPPGEGKATLKSGSSCGLHRFNQHNRSILLFACGEKIGGIKHTHGYASTDLTSTSAPTTLFASSSKKVWMAASENVSSSSTGPPLYETTMSTVFGPRWRIETVASVT